MAKELDLFSNPHFTKWREQIEEAGITLRGMWSAKTRPDAKYDNIIMFITHHKDRNEIGTLIVVDYGSTTESSNGFGLYFEANHATEDDVQIIRQGFAAKA